MSRPRWAANKTVNTPSPRPIPAAIAIWTTGLDGESTANGGIAAQNTAATLIIETHENIFRNGSTRTLPAMPPNAIAPITPFNEPAASPRLSRISKKENCAKMRK
ncbi:MAG: hypothetical protein H7A51_05405 [Akkermansiaceae bacterium]|nr:hypothetical protein [Akkermansiaceae bacterium]